MSPYTYFNKMLEQLPDGELKPIEAQVVSAEETNSGMGLETHEENPKNG